MGCPATVGEDDSHFPKNRLFSLFLPNNISSYFYSPKMKATTKSWIFVLHLTSGICINITSLSSMSKLATYINMPEVLQSWIIVIQECRKQGLAWMLIRASIQIPADSPVISSEYDLSKAFRGQFRQYKNTCHAEISSFNFDTLVRSR